MKKTLLTGLVLAALSPLVFAAPDGMSGATKKASDAAQTIGNVDAITSASVVPQNLRQTVKPNGFTAGDSKAKRILFVVGDPRHESVEWDLVNTAMKHFMDKGCEVELRDLYAIGFNPVITRETFFQAKDGLGETPADVAVEQKYVNAADYIIFAYPNWHDTPNAITKGYMERVFQKKWAYRDTDKGLEGLLKGKAFFTIMNAGWLGMGRGDIGDGIGKNSNPIWDKYLGAFRVMDEDTAGFWGMKTLGRFVNDRTPGNLDKDYAEKLDKLRADLTKTLDKKFDLK
ncbi:NAD(P)H-dependent oxidoreductase [Sutterella seckii]|uniref:NAD(P)H-dependent oxidoreductase n=1 Tax=Sutterella seckii TaxID=1944635 RepID=A0A6I1ECU5_9BURK|nr:NAD(P)H-dependent oxidoreductase [Sutterella seckii]KAB7650859.1 NAD(P)H-dependent oxidoreductase [Sutterella seckii]